MYGDPDRPRDDVIEEYGLPELPEPADDDGDENEDQDTTVPLVRFRAIRGTFRWVTASPLRTRRSTAAGGHARRRVVCRLA